MPPHNELNDRFRAYKKNAQRLRVARTTILVAAFVGLSAIALNAFPGPRELTRSAVTRLGTNPLSEIIANAAALVQSRFDAAHIEITRSEAVAAANSASVADAIGSWFSHLFGTPAPSNITYDRTPQQPTSLEPPPPAPITYAPAPATTTIIRQYITQPVQTRIERVVEKQIPAAFTGPTFSDLAALRTELLANIAQSIPAQPAFVPPQVAAGGTMVIYQGSAPAAQRIDNLDGVTIRNATIIGGSISGTSGAGGGGIGDDATTTTFFSTIGHFTTGIIDALSSAAATITSFTSTELVATNATTTNFAATNASTTNLATGSLTLGSATGVLYASTGAVSAIANGADGKVLKLSGGVPTWGTDISGSGGGSSAWATTTDNLALYTADTSQVALVGASATSTTGNILEVKGNTLLRGTATAYNTITAPTFTATSTTASQLPYASTTAISATSASTTNLIISGSPGGLLKTSVSGTVSLATAGVDYLDQSTTLFATTSADYWKAQRDFFSTTSADAFVAQRNFFSTTSADAFVAQRNFFSTTSTDFWKSGTSFFSTSSTDFWKLSTNFFATTSSDFWKTQNDFFSTTSATYFSDASTSIAKTYTSNTFTGTQTFTNASTTNISSSYASSTAAFFGSVSIGSLTGFLKATAGAITSALVDLASNVTGILPVANGGTGWAAFASAAIPYGNGSGAFATTTVGLPGQVLALLNGIPTWTSTTTLSTISGTLGAGGGGTGIGNPSAAGILLGSYAGGSWQQLATSSLGLLTSDIAEGSNLYWTNARFDTRLSATTTLPNIITLADLALPATQLTNFGAPFYQFFSATTTDVLAQGSTNKYYADSLVQAFVHSSTTIPKTYSNNTFSGSNIFTGTFTLGALNGPLQANAGVISATTSVGVPYGGTGQTSFSSSQLLYGNGTNAVSSVATSSLATGLGLSTAGSAALVGSSQLTLSVATSSLFTGTAGQVPYFSGMNALAGTSTIFVSTAGSVGIGETNPSYPLHIARSTYTSTTVGSNILATFRSNASGADATIQLSDGVANANTISMQSGNLILAPSTGNVGIGTTTPPSKFAVAGDSTAAYLLTIDDTRGDGASGAGTVSITRKSTQVGSITTTPSATAFNTSSDRRVKENIATTTLGLDALMQLPVRSFDFINDPSHATTTGFIAQELQQVFPWAVTTNGDNGTVPLGPTSTPWSVDYGRITPLIVKAVQDIANLNDIFRKNLIAWFADTANGIKDFYAGIVHTNRVETNELCVADVCVTRDEFLQMKEAQSAAAGARINSRDSEAPAAEPASIAEDAGSSTPETSQPSADTANSTTIVQTESVTSATPPSAEQSSEPEGPAAHTPVEIPPAANDNPLPVEDLRASGTD